MLPTAKSCQRVVKKLSHVVLKLSPRCPKWCSSVVHAASMCCQVVSRLFQVVSIKFSSGANRSILIFSFNSFIFYHYICTLKFRCLWDGSGTVLAKTLSYEKGGGAFVVGWDGCRIIIIGLHYYLDRIPVSVSE